MAANRSRTERWFDCLQQVQERDGSIEIALAGEHAGQGESQSASIIWRVRIAALSQTEFLVEQPVALGQGIQIDPGAKLIGGLTIGQNRWMFHTEVIAVVSRSITTGRQAKFLKLALPDRVERCSRRNFYRMSTAELALPRVECWPLLDPTSVGPAEVANRLQILGSNSPTSLGTDPVVLPEVGPRFLARLVNLGGGGAGLIVERPDASALDRSRFFWLRIDLSPALRAPIGLTVRLAHTHIDSMQNVYCGTAFDFSFNPAHRDFVVEQISRYVSIVQGQSAARKSA
jgi:hypothetical protein